MDAERDVYLERLKSETRRAGHGINRMHWLSELADETGVRMFLHASPLEEMVSSDPEYEIARLILFYAQFGFEPIDGNLLLREPHGF